MVRDTVDVLKRENNDLKNQLKEQNEQIKQLMDRIEAVENSQVENAQLDSELQEPMSSEEKVGVNDNAPEIRAVAPATHASRGKVGKPLGDASLPGWAVSQLADESSWRDRPPDASPSHQLAKTTNKLMEPNKPHQSTQT